MNSEGGRYHSFCREPVLALPTNHSQNHLWPFCCEPEPWTTIPSKSHPQAAVGLLTNAWGPSQPFQAIILGKGKGKCSQKGELPCMWEVLNCPPATQKAGTRSQTLLEQPTKNRNVHSSCFSETSEVAHSHDWILPRPQLSDLLAGQSP